MEYSINNREYSTNSEVHLYRANIRTLSCLLKTRFYFNHSWCLNKINRISYSNKFRIWCKIINCDKLIIIKETYSIMSNSKITRICSIIRYNSHYLQIINLPTNKIDMLIYSSLPKIEDIETMRRNRGGEMFRKNRIVWLKKRGRDKKDKEGL